MASYPAHQARWNVARMHCAETIIFLEWTVIDANCLSCENWMPKQNPEMARHKFALCANDAVWKFYPPLQTCAKHKPAEPDIVEKRIAWNKK